MSKKANQNNLSTCIQHLHSIEAEQSVIGCLIEYEDSYKQIASEFSVELFYDHTLRQIAQVIIDLNKENKSADMVGVMSSCLRKGMNIDGLYIANLTTNSVTRLKLQERIYYLKDLRAKRTTIEICQSAIHDVMSNSDDIVDIQSRLSRQIEQSQELLFDVTGLIPLSEYLKESVNEAYQRVETRENGGTIGISTGLNALDKVLNGWQKGSLYILAARPAMGKSAVALHFARQSAQQGCSTAIFSMEMTGANLSDRLILSQSTIDAWRFESGTMTGSELQDIDKAVGTLWSLPIYVDDNCNNSIMKIQTKARALKRKKGLDFIIIDYLQLTDVEDKSKIREQEIAFVSRSAKKMAKDLDIPVLMLSQLSREVEKRQDKRPQLSDLRESGAIEQDADCVMFLYRPEYYKEDLIDPTNENVVKNGMAIITAKNRKGATGDIICQHNGTLHKIFDYNSNPF